MTKIHLVLKLAVTISALACLLPLFAQSTSPKPLLEIKEGAEKRLIPSSGQVVVTRSESPVLPGIEVTIQPGKEDYPGVQLKPEGGAWNLAAYGHVEAKVVNTGVKPLTLALRVDNAGDWKDNPTNTETLTVAPGAEGTVKVIFGHSYGYKPAYALKPAAVVNLLLFAGKSLDVQSFRLISLTAAGPAGEKPPVAPDAVRIVPEGGTLLGAGTRVDAATQIHAQGVKAELSGTAARQALQIVFPNSAGAHEVSIHPATGRWDLRDFLEMQILVRNTGNAPIRPQARLESNGGTSVWVTTAKPLEAGEAATLVIPFGSSGTLNKPENLPRVTSDAVSAVTVAAESAGQETMLRVEAIVAQLPQAPMLEWLGKRPPVPGDWVKTLDEEFSGAALDTKIWSVSGENYWDKTSHWSKDNILLGNGVVKLRYQKKTGFNNDDPKQKSSDYASGYLHTYDRWAQRYGYFEARMKLPTAPGLWPAFWLMPDRGNKADPQWKRQDTANGGMEFDIMENLTRWGGCRYNIAMHWDGYDKDHKSLGSDKIYVQPDKDGYITAGLLWTPGSVVYYCNGREVLRWESPRISNVPEILMFTLPMGGWDNSALEDARLPADFVIDYVRVWQRRDLDTGAMDKK